MKKIIAIGIIGMFILTSFSVFSVAEEPNRSKQITLDYTFEAPVITSVDINGSVYDQIVIDGAPCDGNPGEPNLPAKGAYILLPPKAEVSNIIVDPGQVESLGAGYFIEPAGQPVPISDIDNAQLPVPDEEIYSSTDLFPGELYSEVGIFCFRGYNILVLRLHPVQYIPGSGELFYYPDLTVSVETVEDESTNTLFRGLEKDEFEIMEKIDNPDFASNYLKLIQSAGYIPPDPVPSVEEYDLVIITADSLKDGFIPLKQAHDADGLSTLIYTVEDIYNNYSGTDNAEKIHNFIKYAYDIYGIEYVLLGGDNNIVPVRYLKTLLPIVPSDLYYAGLDGTWNNPENPNPSHKDMSINDPRVSGSSEGIVDGPSINSTDYVVGNDSMQWMINKDIPYGGYGSGSCKLMFDTPLDISGAKWLNFKTRKNPQHITIYPVLLQDNKGRILECKDKFSDIDHEHFSSGSWTTYYVKIPKKIWFNYKAVVSISFEIGVRKAKKGDLVKLDGIYFSDWCNDIGGEPGEDRDLCAEVYVGRACVGNALEVDNFVNKTIAYMSTNPEDEYLRDVLFAGEELFADSFPEKPGSWGGNYLDELIDWCIKHGYITKGFPSSEYNIDKLYDRDWDPDRWPKSEIINKINNNVHIINHVGHSNLDNNMKMYIEDVLNLTNSKYSFIYSMGCVAGAFDNPEDYDDCIAEYLTVKTNYGAFAGIWNARYGMEDVVFLTTDGPSHRYLREFWDAVFGENITAIGKANQDSKEDNLWRINRPFMRYCYYELNLFGDPAVHLFKNNNPNKPDTPSGPTSGEAGIEYEYMTCTSDPDGHDVKYGWDWQGDFIVDEWTDFYPSGTPVTVLNSWSLPGLRWIRVKAKDVFAAESEWSDPLPVTMPVNQPRSKQSTPTFTTGSSPSNG